MKHRQLRFFTGTLVCIICFAACKQNNTTGTADKNSVTDSVLQRSKNMYVAEDQSAMDMSWCPANYPVQKMQGNDSQKLVARLIYSRPHKKGRPIFGSSEPSLCVYGKPWRLGANEATELSFFENVNIAGKNIAKGTYIIYCIPHADRWTIVLNNNLYTWGLHIKESSDIFKTDIPVMQQQPAIEDFTMLFNSTPSGADLLMTWDNVKTILPITFAR